MEILTKNMKKNIMEHNAYNNKFKPNVNKRKYLMYIIVAIVRFMVIYSQFSIILHQLNIVEVNATSLPQPVQKRILYCAVIIDAGSTVSRVLAVVFNKKIIKNKMIDKKSEHWYFELKDQFYLEVEGGLSENIDDESKMKDILDELLKPAKEFINKKKTCGNTPLLFRATAGLRLLSEESPEKSKEILQQVKKIVLNYNAVFKVNNDSVAIMDGDDEGYFSWFSVNFFLGNLRNLEQSVAVFDLGGGSLQITFHPNNNKEYPQDTKCIHHFTIMNESVSFYTHSYLGLGLMAARINVFKCVNITEKLIVTSPCLYPDQKLSYPFNSVVYSVTGESLKKGSAIDYENCKNAIESFLTKSLTVESVRFLDQEIVAINSFYDRAIEAQLIGEDGGDVTIQQLIDTALKTCSNEVYNTTRPFECFDFIYISVLLHRGFGLPVNTSINLERKISEHVIGWVLGAAYNALQKYIKK